MSAKGGSERFSLGRWSRRKLDAAAASVAPAPAPPAPASATVPAASVPSELPPVESLTFDSDFTAFLRPGVDDQVKRAALKQLFHDPRFNVMDGLDTYIDDYTKADPIPADIVADLLQRGFGRAPDADQVPVAAVNVQKSAPVAGGEAPAAALPGGEDSATSVALPGSESSATRRESLLSTARAGEGEQAKGGEDQAGANGSRARGVDED